MMDLVVTITLFFYIHIHTYKYKLLSSMCALVLVWVDVCVPILGS